MKLLVLILSILFSTVVQSQNSNGLKNRQDTINYLKRLIKAEGKVTSIGTGFAGLPSKQYYRFMFLSTMIDNVELVKLVNNSTGCLRIYAYMALYHNKYSGLTEIQNILKNDTTRVTAFSGCDLEFISVAEIVSRITDWYWENNTNEILVQLKKNKDYRISVFNNISILDN